MFQALFPPRRFRPVKVSVCFISEFQEGGRFTLLADPDIVSGDVTLSPYQGLRPSVSMSRTMYFCVMHIIPPSFSGTIQEDSGYAPALAQRLQMNIRRYQRMPGSASAFDVASLSVSCSCSITYHQPGHETELVYR